MVAVSTGWILSKCISKTAVVLSVGTSCVFTGAWIGSIFAFLIGRYLIRDSIRHLTTKSKLFRVIDKTV